MLTLAAEPRLLRWVVVPGKRADELTVRFLSAGPVPCRPPVIEKQKRTVGGPPAGGRLLQRKTGALDNPTRVFLDFTNAEIPPASGRNISAGPIAQVRLGQQTSEGETPVGARGDRIAHLAKFRGKGRGRRPRSLLFRPARAGEEPSSAPWPAGPPSKIPSDRWPDEAILIDPGHGGGDTGALWTDGKDEVDECDVTFAIAQRVQRLLKKAGAKVTLTHRRRDAYVTPAARRELTNRLRPDAFVSIHCNSAVVESASGTASGTEVWFTSEASQTLAMLIEEEVVGELGTCNRGIKYTTELAVVNHSCCPAVLVEVGFLSDAGDRALLTDPASQERAARPSPAASPAISREPPKRRRNEATQASLSRAAVLAVLLLAGLGGAAVYAWRVHPEWLKNFPNSKPIAPSALRVHPNLSSRPAPVRLKTVAAKIYFMQVTNGEVCLAPVSRTLPAAAPARLAIQELLTGPLPKDSLRPLPAGTKLRGVKVKDHLATVDFSRDLVSDFHGGADSEQAAVYAIVNTLTSLPGVEKVQILVDGKPCDTLGGHLDLREPRGPSR